MKSIGIICEYNPFHNGHIYHINKIKEMYPDCTLILVMSGNFTQRGDVSLIDKWKKCEIALNFVDLVVELPFIFATQSADIFAKGAVTILNNLEVDAIIFGSESNNVNELINIAKIQKKKEFNITVKKYLKEGVNYPTALSKAVYDLSGQKINSPNDLLGISYIKEILKTNITPITIKRTNQFHDKTLTKISSATALREALSFKKSIRKYVPKETQKHLKDLKFNNDYFPFLKYKIISTDISKYVDVDEGIENKIYEVIENVNSYDELIRKIKNKRFTYSKIKRMLIHILCGFTKEEAKKHKDIKYIRVLGFNKKGKEYLKKLNKKNIPIITTYRNDLEMLQIETRVSLIYNNDIDYKHKPIIK